MQKLEYAKLRRILALGFQCKGVRQSLSDFFSGKELKLSVTELLELVYTSEIDCQIAEILTGKKSAKLDAFEVLEVLSDFFTYLAANAKKLKSLQSLFSFRPASPDATPSKG